MSAISEAASRLWQLDLNRFSIGPDLVLDLQSGKRVFENGDVAPNPLFKYVNPALYERPTYAYFIKLLDNYVAEAGTAEIFTDVERQEMKLFLDSACDTPVMKYLHRYAVVSLLQFYV